MRKLEERYGEHVAVVGVHSGKYTAERVTERIRDASIRLGATHPVLNDRQFRVWRAYAVRAWPTLVAVDPRGYVVGTHAGEFTVEAIAPFVERTLATARAGGLLEPGGLHFTAERAARFERTLRYPGKVVVHGEGERARIAISDSGHHRVLVGRLEDGGRRARIEHVFGGTRGFADGAGDIARFAYPQGLCFGGERTLYVADSANHAIREIDVAGGQVRTVAGTGEPLRTREDMRSGALSSPWDVAVVGTTLFVAMAGIHQIWGLERGARGAPVMRIGSGAEEIHDGSHLDAALAQPMGITSAGGRLYFVDAESSAVRWAHIDPSGRVGTIVGTGLFDFGDKDGVGDDVRMQHQQAVAAHSDGRLLVADSYNDALKWVDPASRRAETWLRGFAEPSGVAISGNNVYVADTNAHRIALATIGETSVREVEIEM